MPIVQALNLPTQKITTHRSVAPIRVNYALDKETKNHLQKLIADYRTEQEIENLEKEIRRAVRFGVYRMNEEGILYKQGIAPVKLIFRAKKTGNTFGFIFTILNGKSVVVNKIRVKNSTTGTRI